MEFENNIKCNIFLDTEAVIKNTEVKIRDAKNSKERQYFVQDMLLEAESVLSCSNYTIQSSDCVNCHSIVHKFIQEYKPLAKENEKGKTYV